MKSIDRVPPIEKGRTQDKGGYSYDGGKSHQGESHKSGEIQHSPNPREGKMKYTLLWPGAIVLIVVLMLLSLSQNFKSHNRFFCWPLILDVNAIILLVLALSGWSSITEIICYQAILLWWVFKPHYVRETDHQ